MSMKELAQRRKLNHVPVPVEKRIKAKSKAETLKDIADLEKDKAKRSKPKNKVDLIDVERIKSKSVEMGILAQRINAMNLKVNQNGENVIFHEDEKMLLAYLKIYTDIQYKNRDLDLAGAEMDFAELQEKFDALFSLVFEMEDCEHHCMKKLQIGITEIVG